MRGGRGCALALVVLLAVLPGCGGDVTGEPLASTPSGTTSIPAQTPSPTVDVGADEVHLWPTTARNEAGVYSWCKCIERSVTAISRNEGVMHNGYEPGSGDVSILFRGDPGRLTPHRGQTAVTVAEHEGTYRRFLTDHGHWRYLGKGGRAEEWMVDVQGTTVTFLLLAKPGAPEAELAEAHEVIDSIRVEAQDNELGFRLLFTLATDTWDSG